MTDKTEGQERVAALQGLRQVVESATPAGDLAMRLRDAISKLQTATDLAAYFSGASDTLPDLEKARSAADDLADEVERLEAKLAGPCGSCHPCVNWAHETWVRADRQPPHLHVFDAMKAELQALEAFRDAVEAELRKLPQEELS